MIDSILKVVRGLVGLIGQTDGTLIGNVSDSIKSIDISSGANAATPPTYSTQIGADDGTNLQNLQGRTDTPEDNAFGLVVRPQPHEHSTFVVLADAIALGNKKHMVSLLNASGSGKVVRIRSIRMINIQTTAVTGVIADFRFYRMTGHSGGTSIIPQSYDTSDTLNVNITARTGGTIAGLFTPYLFRYLASSDEWGVGATDVESFSNTIQSVSNIIQQQGNCKSVILRAGEGATIRCETNSTAGTFLIELLFTEEPE